MFVALFFTTILQNWAVSSHFTDEGHKAQENRVYPNSHNWEVAEPEYEPHSLNGQSPHLSGTSHDRAQPAADKSRKSSSMSNTDA